MHRPCIRGLRCSPAVRRPSVATRGATISRHSTRAFTAPLADDRRSCCAGWVEALEEILHNSRAPQILRQPDGTYLFAVQVCGGTASPAGLVPRARSTAHAFSTPAVCVTSALAPFGPLQPAQTSVIALCTQQWQGTHMHFLRSHRCGACLPDSLALIP